MTDKITAIDRLLPQTQCGLCEYDGCKPYATAIVNEGEQIDRCLPGGIRVLKTLGEALNLDPSPYYSDMSNKQKPPLIAVIREDECIGCTKCIQACPVDAITGAAKLMHTIMASECTGCELCIEPCPVDCIDMIALAEPLNPERSDHWRHRYLAHQKRHPPKTNVKKQPLVTDEQDYIAAALARVQKKNE